MRFIVGLLLFGAVVALSTAVPVKRNLVYIDQPNQASYYGAPARLMYLQSVQQSSPFARSQQGGEAFVAGGSVSAGSYLENGVEKVELEASQGFNNEEILSVAEAYPEQPQVDVDFQAPADSNFEISDDEGKTPIGVPKEAREFNFDSPAVDLPAIETVPENGEVPAAVFENNETPLAEFDPSFNVVTEASVSIPEIPANPTETIIEEAPARRFSSSKKKIFVELETPKFREGDENEDDGEVVEEPVRPPKAAKRPVKDVPAASKPTTPLPPGSFFPINFGGTSGGAIAIANSFSTGEGGSATSHAIAYGAPGTARPTTRSRKN